MTKDTAIDEIRRVLHEISHEVGHNLRRLKNTFEQLQTQFQKPPVEYGGKRVVPPVPNTGIKSTSLSPSTSECTE